MTFHISATNRSTARRLGGAATAVMALLLSAGTAVAHAAEPTPVTPPDTTSVTYRGLTLDVPSAWSVVNLEEHPDTCARFDTRTIYLGHPTRQDLCPAHLVASKDDALLVEPLAGAAVQNPAAVLKVSSPAQVTDGALTNDDHETKVAVEDAGLLVTATYRTAADEVAQTLRTGRVGSGAQPGQLAGQRTRSALSAASAATDDYTGKGFDACTAPSSSTMSAWSASPYRAVGVYIAGSHRACAQPNLTAGWVERQTDDGWHLMPIHVGEQASDMSATGSAAEGKSAAEDAVSAAKALGFPAGTVLYSDIEYYSSSSYRGRVLNYLSAWSRRLHELGYRSGAYVSATGGASDLASVYNNSDYERMDVVWTANWNGAADVSDSSMALPSGVYTGAHRAHQYAGNVTETYGGASVNIDRNYVKVAGSAAPLPEAPRAEPSQRVNADFNGDGRDDVAAVYGYDDGTVALFTWLSRADGGFADPVKSWSRPPGNWTFKSMKMTAGDYNGDGRADVAGMYDYADGSVALFTWLSAADGTFGSPTKSWTTEPGNWYPEHVQLASGDFDGNGRDDVAAFYGYNDGRAALFTFKSTATGGFSSPLKSWNVPEGYWWGEHVKFTSGDFNGDGRTDTAALYGYDDGTVSLFTWLGRADGGFADPVKSWTRAPGNWTFESVSLTSGDYNGDGRADLAGMYDYADGSVALFTWPSSANGTFATDTKSWTTEPGNWYPEHVQLASGDFDGNGRDDVAAFYGYSDGRAALYTFKSTASGGFSTPLKSWNVPAAYWWGEHVKFI